MEFLSFDLILLTMDSVTPSGFKHKRHYNVRDHSPSREQCPTAGRKGKSTLHLLLWTDVTVMSTLALAAVGSLWWESGVALSANHFFAFVGSGQSGEGWLNLDGSETTSTESQNEMEGGLLLDVVVRESAAIFELLSSEDKSLLIRWNSFLILDLSPMRDKKLNKRSVPHVVTQLT